MTTTPMTTIQSELIRTSWVGPRARVGARLGTRRSAGGPLAAGLNRGSFLLSGAGRGEARMGAVADRVDDGGLGRLVAGRHVDLLTVDDDGGMAPQPPSQGDQHALGRGGVDHLDVDLRPVLLD